MTSNNVVSLNESEDSMTPSYSKIEGDFHLLMGRAMAMADLLSNSEERPYEFEPGTITTTGCEILSSLKEAREKFEQLLQLHIQSRDGNLHAEEALA